MTKEKPFVQIIIVTWNKKNDVLRLLNELQKLDYPPDRYAIMVVDNNSDDGTIRSIEKNFPDVDTIQNHTNLGGSGGFNSGMRWAMEQQPIPDYLWLLDNDVLVDPDALSALVNVLETDPDAGMCGSKILNSENHDDFIELGAFIDYRKGCVKRNSPASDEMANPEAVFSVDYVAACSLLVHSRIVKQIGLWHEDFFIYWDDMEWGVRCNSHGYKVLAANSSIVYHPSWAKRTLDNSAIWRNYYRFRNGLCFFNNYTTGIKRRLILIRLIIKYTCLSVIFALRSQISLSLAIIAAMNDFQKDRYGRKNFNMPSTDISSYFHGTQKCVVCLYIDDSYDASIAKDFLKLLHKKYPNMETLCVVPWETSGFWKEFPRENVLCIKRPEKASWIDTLRILNFLRKKKWDLLLTGDKAPWVGALFGKNVVRIDFEKNTTIAIEKFNFQLCIPILTMFFYSLFRVIFSLPAKNLVGNKF